ncbi:MAG: hypothetical protein A2145_02670 [candidate division Zixibacteria bacterium RBG_16_40_9]|nr:MAG: hypothetical protein A2145_02670 [candidate division Zixibacteria bacterium RBG_16_40_9]
MKKLVKKNNQIKVPSDLDYLAEVDKFVEQKLKKTTLNKSQLADIAISVTEAVTNAMLHGNKKDPHKEVTIDVEVKPKEIVITIQDQGNGFDPDKVPNPTQGDLIKVAGRGVFIYKTLMDKVEFFIKPHQGTTVKMVKEIKPETK